MLTPRSHGLPSSDQGNLDLVLLIRSRISQKYIYVGRAIGSLHIIVLFLALIILASCSSSSSTILPLTPSATKVPTSLSGVDGPTPVATLLASAPTDCQQVVPAPAFKDLPGNWGGFHESTPNRLVGREPVWIYDFSNVLNTNSDEALHVNGQGYTPWPATKILWEVAEDNPDAHLVTVKVTNQRSGKLAWWNPEDHPMQTLTLREDMATYYHGPVEPGWQEWGTILSFSEAGCYKMDVSWPDGHWSMVFAVGR